jgi:hypothetical protein
MILENFPEDIELGSDRMINPWDMILQKKTFV